MACRRRLRYEPRCGENSVDKVLSRSVRFAEQEYRKKES